MNTVKQETMQKTMCSPNALIQARRSFKIRLVHRQLDDASFLYDQRRFLLESDQLPWMNAANNEKRFLHHLWALVELTRKDYLDIEGLIEDTGALHTAVCLLCRQGRFERLRHLVDNADLMDAGVFNAVADGLKWEAPDIWGDRLVNLFRSREDRGFDLLSVVFGYRRWSLNPIFALHKGRLSMSRPLIWAVGRSGGTHGIDRLKDVIAGDDDSLKADASIALLRWGSHNHLKGVRPFDNSRHWACLPLGLYGRPGIEAHLESLVDGDPSADTLLSLGLMGKTSSVEHLILHTAHKTLGQYASAALQLITGANLFETVFVPDEIDPDILTEEETARLHRGEPVYADGNIPGDTVDRLSQNPSSWRDFWDENRFRFNPKIPYRLGRPYSPVAPLDTLLSPYSSHLIRALAYEETVIRHGVNLVFETDFLVDEQQCILSAFKQQLGSHKETAVRYTGSGRV